MTNEKFSLYETVCAKIIQDQKVSFAGFVNNKGRLVAHSNTERFEKFGNENSLEMFLMTISLEFSMKRDFDDLLGPLQYIVSKRTKSNVICFPFDELILVVVIKEPFIVEVISKEICQIIYKTSDFNGDSSELV